MKLSNSLYLVAAFISPQKVYTFSSRGGERIPKSVKCTHSATKYIYIYNLVDYMT